MRPISYIPVEHRTNGQLAENGFICFRCGAHVRFEHRREFFSRYNDDIYLEIQWMRERNAGVEPSIIGTVSLIVITGE
jgi:hypothetical protein